MDYAHENDIVNKTRFPNNKFTGDLMAKYLFSNGQVK